MLTDAQKADGWIEHDGGPCPVDPHSKPGVMIRGFGSHHICQQPGYHDEAGVYDWHHNPATHPADIIAYRPEPKP